MSDQRVLDETGVSDADWRLIKNSLKPVGIDADAVMVETTLGDLPLRQALPVIAEGADIEARLRRYTPAQAAAKLKETQAQLAAVLGMLDDRLNYNYLNPVTGDWTFPRPASIEPARTAVIALIDDLKRRCEKLADWGQQEGGQNARTVRNDFLRELACIWDGRGGARSRHKHFHLQNFLRACSASIFCSPPTDTALAAFTKEFFARPRRKQRY